jgi:putative transposase
MIPFLNLLDKSFFIGHPLDGYRRIAFMMLDKDILAVSPSTVYRVLSTAGLLGVREVMASKKGTGFEQPIAPHEHWHVDVSYINLGGTFYYLAAYWMAVAGPSCTGISRSR